MLWWNKIASKPSLLFSLILSEFSLTLSRNQCSERPSVGTGLCPFYRPGPLCGSAESARPCPYSLTDSQLQGPRDLVHSCPSGSHLEPYKKVYFHAGRVERGEHSTLKETNGNCRVLLIGETVCRDRGGTRCSLYMLLTFSVRLRLLRNIKSIFF